MKTRIGLLLAAVLIAGSGLYYRAGAQGADGGVRIAVVDVAKALEGSKKHQAWKQKMEKEQEAAKKEFNDLRAEVEQLQENIKLRKPGSDEHIKLTQQMVEKKAMLDAKNSFYEEKVSLQMQTWSEDLYKQFLVAVDKIAQQKGIDLVLAKEQLDLPAPSLRDFLLTIKTRKVLFFNPKIDITAEVQAELDSQK